MKRISKVLFVLVIFLCSGCTISYNLEVKESEITENIMINDTYINGRTSSGVLNDYNAWMPVYDNIDDLDLIMDGVDNGGKIEGIEYHEKTITKINNGYYHTYKYTYPLDKFNHANSLKLAFAKPKVYDGYDYVNIKTNNENVLCNYDYFESLQVNIKVDLNAYKVEQSNASSVKGNIYTWNLNRNNCLDSSISLTLNKINNSPVSSTTKSSIVDNGKKIINNYVFYIFLGLFILIIIFGYRWFNKMKDRENTI